MSFFTDLFNPVFLMFLGILTIVLGLIIIYFESKMREQNHKISSMLSLVSSLAEEINNVKIGLNHLTMMTGGNFPYKQNMNNINILEKINEEDNTMINVSDDEDDDEDDEEDDEEEDEDEDEYDDDEDENTVINIHKNNDVKILKINMNEQEISKELNHLEDIKEIDEYQDIESIDDELNQLDIVSDSESEIEEQRNFSLFNNNQSNQNNDHFISFQPVKEINNENLTELLSDNFDLKSINISNLEESKNDDNIDYKKMSLTKLKSIVYEKGLSKDTSKLKKHELLKLLDLVE
jgi:hypothetical protein